MNYDSLYDEKCLYSLQKIDIDPLKKYFIKKEGWVYIAKSKDHPHLKIGRTSKNPMIRAKTLSTTGVLNSYEILFSLKFFNQYWAEKNIHKALKNFNIAKEFFSIDESIAIKLIFQAKDLEDNLLNRFLNTELIKDDIELIEYSLRK